MGERRERVIVLVEDDRVQLMALRMLVEQTGSHALAAPTAEAALQAVRSLGRAPDLIVSDLRLAGDGDGFAAIDRIREACGRPVPAILLSGENDEELLRRASTAGHRFLLKPLSPTRLLAAIEQEIGRAD